MALRAGLTQLRPILARLLGALIELQAILGMRPMWPGTLPVLLGSPTRNAAHPLPCVVPASAYSPRPP